MVTLAGGRAFGGGGGYLFPPLPCGCCLHNEGSLACPGSLKNKSWTLAVGL